MELKNRTYAGAPWCLGRYDRFEINKPQLITLLGHDYVIWKDRSGNLNAINNICPHAGANLAQGGYIINFQGKDCLACPYHGNKVQFSGDGTVIIDGSISTQAIQQVLPLQIVDRLVWTYGLNWYEQDGNLTTTIEPKLPIPDYSNIPHLPQSHSQLQINELDHIYSRSHSVNCNILQAIWNIHDAEHFAGTHRDTMLAKKAKIEHLIHNENQLSWQLITHKRDDKDVWKNKMNLLIEPTLIQSFNTFLPSLSIITLNFRKQLIVSVVSMYPESARKTNLCLDIYSNSDFTWWQKLFLFPQIANNFRDRLVLEDISILENLYPNFDKKIALKNDTPAQLAMNYLNSWN